MNTIDIDTGGTFTDGVFRLAGRVVTVKVDTTPHDPVDCFVRCIEDGASQLGLEGSELLEATDIIRYATTAATNAIVQKKGTKIGLLVTKGAEDHLYHEQSSEEIPISKFLDQSLIAGINEGIDEQGNVSVDLDEESIREATELLLDRGARLLIVAFQNAALNPANELKARELFETLLPSFYLGRPFVLLSHQLSAAGTNAQRLNSAVISGYLHHELVTYLYRCDDSIRRLGYRHPLLVVHSTGGLARVAKTKALNTYNSGPTAGVFGAARIARRYGLPKVVTMDMGGTSTDIAFIQEGREHLSFQAEIERVAVSMPMIDVVGLGGGGGSLASFDGGALRVGPESAGAVPGPACYDLGNSVPTVTDANVVLGLISPGNFLGGRRQININRASQAIADTVAKPQNLDIDDAAHAIRSVLAEELARSIRNEAQKRSFSIQDAVLFAYGGAGPLHAAEIATATGISSFYMFPESPVFSAAGLSTMDIKHFYEAPVRVQEGLSVSQAFTQIASGLMHRAHCDIRGEGFDSSMTKLQFVLEMPDGGELTFAFEDLESVAMKAAIGSLLRLIATIESGEPADKVIEITSSSSASSETRREICWVEGRKMTDVYSLAGLEPGVRIAGPALIETDETTCVIPEGWRSEVDQYGALKVQRD